MRETTFTDLRNHAKTFFDAVEEGEIVRVYCNGRPVADIVPVKAAMPAWKKPPLTRLSLGGLSLSDEVLADRDPAPRSPGSGLFLLRYLVVGLRFELFQRNTT